MKQRILDATNFLQQYDEHINNLVMIIDAIDKLVESENVKSDCNSVLELIELYVKISSLINLINSQLVIHHSTPSMFTNHIISHNIFALLLRESAQFRNQIGNKIFVLISEDIDEETLELNDFPLHYYFKMDKPLPFIINSRGITTVVFNPELQVRIALTENNISINPIFSHPASVIHLSNMDIEELLFYKFD